MVITIASKIAVTTSVMIHTLSGACVSPPDGWAAAKPTPRLTVTRPTAHQVIWGSFR
jgi:hypothetical protein